MSAAVIPEPPRALPVNRDGILAEMKDPPQWVGWKQAWIPDRQRWTKVPIDPRTGLHASSTDPATWGPFDDVLALAVARGLPGVGFVVTPHDPYVGIDIDTCRDPETGAIASWAMAIVDRFDSYTEITPSGTGLRIWIRSATGLLPGDEHGRRRGPIEVYGAGRYFTVTGHRLERSAE